MLQEIYDIEQDKVINLLGQFLSLHETVLHEDHDKLHKSNKAQAIMKNRDMNYAKLYDGS